MLKMYYYKIYYAKVYYYIIQLCCTYKYIHTNVIINSYKLK